MHNSEQSSYKAEVSILLEHAIVEVGIPPCPAILERFVTEAEKSEPDFHRLSKIIAADVSLSASLIKTANSPYFGTRQPVRSSSDALAILGLNTTSHAVAGIVLSKTFLHVPRLERFWDASARIARVSGWLAQQFDLGIRSEDAYTFGLFRDCGIPVLLERHPGYGEILAKANKEPVINFTEVENTELSTNHAVIGSTLAQSWWLPEEIYLAIRNHHDHQTLNPANATLPTKSHIFVATSQLAEHFVQHHLGLSFTEEWPKLGSTCLEILDVDESYLEELYNETEQIVNADE